MIKYGCHGAIYDHKIMQNSSIGLTDRGRDLVLFQQGPVWDPPTYANMVITP